MCLIFVAFNQHPQWPIIIASNRDEFFQRPSKASHFWAGQCNLLGGLDQEQGGTWLAVNRQGRFAAVTNYRDPSQPQGQLSRGHLVRDFVAGTVPPSDYLNGLSPSLYSGYNLLLGNSQALHYGSNRGPQSQSLNSGIYGLSNHLLDTPWPKLTAGKAEFSEAIRQPDFTVDQLFEVMSNDAQARDEQLPNTGVEQAAEQVLSARFIHAGQGNSDSALHNYGTRTTTIVLIKAQGGGHWFERNHSPAGINTQQTLAFTW